MVLPWMHEASLNLSPPYYIYIRKTESKLQCTSVPLKLDDIWYFLTSRNILIQNFDNFRLIAVPLHCQKTEVTDVDVPRMTCHLPHHSISFDIM